jgi:periplasmic protein TonB
MSNVSIYEKNWLKLVFENKNQAYGAYVLRLEHQRTSLIALFLGIAFLASGIAVCAMLMSFSSTNELTEPIIPKTPTITVTKVNLKDDLKVESSKPTTQKPITEPKVNLFSKLVVAKETEPIIDVQKTEKPVIKIDVPEGKDNLGGTTVSQGSGQGLGGGTTVNGAAFIPEAEIPKGPVSTTELDKLPEFPNGMDKFYKYVSDNFTKPELEEAFMFTVLVVFIIEENGSMTNIRVTRNPGYGMGEEAIRVLKSLKVKWSPGIKDGKPVRTFYTLPIKIKT